MTISGINMFYNGSTATKNVSIVKYFTKVKPVLSFVRNTDNELVVSISNPSDSAKSFTITKFKATGTVSTASLNGQDVDTGGNIDAGKQVTLNKNGSTELRLGINATGTVKLTGITIEVEDGNKTYTYEITDKYTNVATW
jgi:hypothetical protein